MLGEQYAQQHSLNKAVKVLKLRGMMKIYVLGWQQEGEQRKQSFDVRLGLGAGASGCCC